MPSYLVTGCAGFIGARVAELLLEQGHRVMGIDNLEGAGGPALREWRLSRLRSTPDFQFQQADIRDVHTVAKVVASAPPDAVINMAAKTGVRESVRAPLLYAETNYMAVINLLEACRQSRVGKFVQASTSSVYGADTPAPFRESAPAAMPLSPYAASKKAAEEVCYAYHHLHGLDVTVLRLFTVYGAAGRPDMAVFRFVKAVVEDEPLTLYGDGGERDFTHVDDAARGIIAASSAAMGYRILNLGGGRAVSVRDLVSAIERVVGKRARVEIHPRPAADVDSTWADISEADRLLGWQPQVRLESGIRETVEWYLGNRSWARDLT